MARGGRRSGAGRKPGSVNRRTQEIAEKASAEGITPLEVMIQAMRSMYYGDDGKQRNATAAFGFAKECAPFMHPRLQPIAAKVHLAGLYGTPTEQGNAVLAALGRGELAPDVATTIIQALAAQARIIEVDELERRVTELEKAHVK
jgi:hypothetical protein